jgi:cytoskeletal protein RodZ
VSRYEPQYGQPHQPWFRSAPVLLGLGALIVIVLGALVFALMKLSSPATTPTAATSSPASSTAATTSRHSGGGNGQTIITEAPQAPETVTATATDAPVTTTDAPTTTSPTVDTSTSTVTQTVTAGPTRQNFNSGGGFDNGGRDDSRNTNGH